MNYRVEYNDQSWEAANIKAPSPVEAAKRYLLQDSEMRWHYYEEIIVSWGAVWKRK